MPLPHLKALAFDAYGTLFDVLSVTTRCDECFPGRGLALAQAWRAKQLQYSLLRSLMDRYADFWQCTEDGLVHAANALRLELTGERRRALMEAYLSLAAFPDVRPGLDALRGAGLPLAILSNGAPRMLAAAAAHAGIAPLLDAIISADDARVFKPSPRVYGLLSDRLGLPRASIGFVSSNSWDIAGAANAGFPTVWIQRAGAEPPEVLAGAAESPAVATLTELAARLSAARDAALRPESTMLRP